MSSRRNLQIAARAFPSGSGGSAAIFTATPTALAIDDDPVARTRLHLLLTNLGVQVKSCASVAEGLAALQDDIGENGCVTFTRIFCDLAMPDAMGDGLLGLLTSSGWPCSIVMVSGTAASVEERAKCEAMGATAVLSKPVREAELADYFVGDVSRDGRAAESSQLANALLVASAEPRGKSSHAILKQAPAWTQWTNGEAGAIVRAVSAPRLHGRDTSAHDNDAAILEWTHTSAAVHALAMGSALALAVHVEATDKEAAQGPVGAAAEVRRARRRRAHAAHCGAARARLRCACACVPVALRSRCAHSRRGHLPSPSLPPRPACPRRTGRQAL
jgi:CheY-like chemotaxis protein